MLTDDQVDRIITDIRIDKAFFPASDVARILQHAWGFQYREPNVLRDEVLQVIRALLEQDELSILEDGPGSLTVWAGGVSEMLSKLENTSRLLPEKSGLFSERGWNNISLTLGHIEPPA